MRIRWNFTGCTDSEKMHSRLTWLAVEPALEARLELIAATPIELIFSVAHFARQTLPWRVHATLRLTGSTYVADVQMSTSAVAVDECVALIAEQLAEDPQLDGSWSDSRDGLAAAMA